MSPAVKRARPSDAQAMAWARAYFKAHDGEEWARPPKWSKVMRTIDAQARELAKVQRAAADPLAPGAAATLIAWADGCSGLGDVGPPCEADVWFYALAFKWAAKGAPKSTLRELEAERQRRKAERDAEDERLRTPETTDRITLGLVEMWADNLIGTALGQSKQPGYRALTREERVALLQRLTEALLGYPVIFDWDEENLGPADELPTGEVRQ